MIPAPVLAAVSFPNTEGTETSRSLILSKKTISQVVAALSAAAIDIQAEINSLANIVSADVPELDVVLTGILTANGLLTKAEGLLKGVGAKA